MYFFFFLFLFFIFCLLLTPLKDMPLPTEREGGDETTKQIGGKLFRVSLLFDDGGGLICTCKE